MAQNYLYCISKYLFITIFCVKMFSVIRALPSGARRANIPFAQYSSLCLFHIDQGAIIILLSTALVVSLKFAVITLL